MVVHALWVRSVIVLYFVDHFVFDCYKAAFQKSLYRRNCIFVLAVFPGHALKLNTAKGLQYFLDSFCGVACDRKLYGFVPAQGVWMEKAASLVRFNRGEPCFFLVYQAGLRVAAALCSGGGLYLSGMYFTKKRRKRLEGVNMCCAIASACCI